MDDKNIYSNSEKLKLQRACYKDVAILKSNKENGVVLINNVHDYLSLEHSFIDKKQIQKS